MKKCDLATLEFKREPIQTRVVIINKDIVRYSKRVDNYKEKLVDLIMGRKLLITVLREHFNADAPKTNVPLFVRVQLLKNLKDIKKLEGD